MSIELPAASLAGGDERRQRRGAAASPRGALGATPARRAGRAARSSARGPLSASAAHSAASALSSSAQGDHARLRALARLPGRRRPARSRRRLQARRKRRHPRRRQRFDGFGGRGPASSTRRGSRTTPACASVFAAAGIQEIQRTLARNPSPARTCPNRAHPLHAARSAAKRALPRPIDARRPAQRVLHTSPVSPKPSACLVASVRSNSRPATYGPRSTTGTRTERPS